MKYPKAYKVYKSFKYTSAADTNIRKKFAEVVKRQATQAYFTKEELADSAKPIPLAPIGWRNTELSAEEWEEAMKDMDSDYAEMGTPYTEDSNGSRQN